MAMIVGWIFRRLTAFISSIFKFKDAKAVIMQSEIEKLNTKLIKLLGQEDEFVVSLNSK